jgi:hypothetical protein
MAYLTLICGSHPWSFWGSRWGKGSVYLISLDAAAGPGHSLRIIILPLTGQSLVSLSKPKVYMHSSPAFPAD